MTGTEPVTPLAIYAAAAVLIPIVVQVVKGAVPAAWWRFSPLLSVLLGLGVSVGVAQGFPDQAGPWIVTVVHGTATGLSAAGLYSGLRANGVPIPGPTGKPPS